MQEEQASVLGEQVSARAAEEVGSVPVEARKQSRATLPLSRAAEHPLQAGMVPLKVLGPVTDWDSAKDLDLVTDWVTETG